MTLLRMQGHNTCTRFISIAKVLLICVLLVPAHGETKQAQRAGNGSSSSIVSSYTLTPDRYRQAHELGRKYFAYELLTFLYLAFVLALIIKLRIALTFSKWAEKVSNRRLVQAFIFTPLLTALLAILLLPNHCYRHWLGLEYGLSIQSWSSWLWDWTKFQIVVILLASFVAWLLYSIIRKSPGRWWLYFWFASLPLSLVLVFLQPLIFDPLFHKFEPLAEKDRALATELQGMVKRAGENIPEERMFWMQAAHKTTTLNAYVTGFGASKRIVVWDTTIAKMTTPQIVFVAGHEMGHFVLEHIAKGLLITAVILFLVSYFGSWCATRFIHRKGDKWGIYDVADWGSMPLLLFLALIISFLLSPLSSAIGRYFEHQADQYALEVTHGLNGDSGQIGAQAFQMLGDLGLEDPDPNPLAVFMFYDHPPIKDRVTFSLTYDPWAKGESGEFVK